MEGLNKCRSVIPVETGIRKINSLDPGLCRSDELFRSSV